MTSADRRVISTSIEFVQGGTWAGYRLEWYRDDDGGSGYGEAPEVAYWYGNTYQECVNRAAGPVPAESHWSPL